MAKTALWTILIMLTLGLFFNVAGYQWRWPQRVFNDEAPWRWMIGAGIVLLVVVGVVSKWRSPNEKP